MPRRIRIFILILVRFAFVIANKVLLFLLPLPFFPNVSVALAKFVGIPPLTLNQLKFNLPIPNLLSFIPSFMRKSDKTPQMKPVITEPTISIGEKIRTWRQRHLIEARGITARMEVVPQVKSRKKIENVEFEAPIQGINKIVCESIEALQQVSTSTSEMS